MISVLATLLPPIEQVFNGQLFAAIQEQGGIVSELGRRPAGIALEHMLTTRANPKRAIGSRARPWFRRRANCFLCSMTRSILANR